MARGFSLHIGLNNVDTNHYGNIRVLAGAENDPLTMERIARARGFETEMLIGAGATAERVTSAVTQAAGTLKAGDIFVLTYAGHGSQVLDRNGDESENGNLNDGFDETWCVYDRMLVDDELYALWSKFAPGVRIAMFSDSCHSGTVTRMAVMSEVIENVVGAPPRTIIPGAPRLLDKRQSMEIYARHKEMYDAIQAAHADGIRVPIEASVILISACQDNQLAGDGSVNGAFTAALDICWENGVFVGSHDAFRKEIASLLPNNQSPNYYVIGTQNLDFERQTPFTI